MWRFGWYRRRHMKKFGGFWVRMPHYADMPGFPLFPWQWVEPDGPLTPGDFRRHGILVDQL